MTKMNRNLTLDDLNPRQPPENGETILYQSKKGHLVSHGPEDLLVEAVGGFTLESGADGMQEVEMAASCKLY